jgi:hypothetical protein
LRDPELTPDQEERVRRLLAEARHEGPIPDDVADRLDRVLGDLSRDEPSEEGRAGVVDLAARRRRRNAAALLAGAAAVIVAGFAVGQAIDVGDSADDAGSTAAEPADREQSSDLAEAPGAGDAGGESGAQALEPGAPLELHSKTLDQDVTDQLSLARDTGVAKGTSPEALAAFGCATAAPAAYGTGKFFAAYYDGIPALLALRPAAGETQRADVLECGTAAELGSVTLPRR